MRKVAAVFLSSTYLFLAHYCLVFGMVTGDPHMAFRLRATESAGHRGHCGGMDDPSAPRPASSEPCCANLLCGKPVAVPEARTLTTPSLSFHFVLLEPALPMAGSGVTSEITHIGGPPGLSAASPPPCLSLLSPRAPPALA